MGIADKLVLLVTSDFGRTPKYNTGDGKDHWNVTSVLVSGPQIRGGRVVGKTDDFSYKIVETPVHIHDLQATILHCLGLDHERLTYRFQGRDYRLTDVSGRVVRDIVT